MITPAERTRGGAVAAVLSGAWRSAPPLDLSLESLDTIAPCLLESGAGSLAWWRVRQTPLRTSRSGRELREAYRQDTLEVAQLEEEIPRLFALLRAAGVEPLLIKGWSAARFYPETGLRPYCDIDLCVRPDQLDQAKDVLSDPHLAPVDLHEGVPEVSDRGWDELYCRSELVPLGDVPIRVLSREGQLRLMCLHCWRHNVHRPLWLCDIAVLLETLPAEFDWDYFLSGDSVLTDWTLAVIGLARRLLGAEVTLPPAAARADELPSWLLRCVLWKWGTTEAMKPFSHYLRRPLQFPAAVLYRWLDPIKAIFRMGLKARTPMVLIQLASLLGRPVEVVRRIERLFRKRRQPEHPFEVHLQSASRFL